MQPLGAATGRGRRIGRRVASLSQATAAALLQPVEDAPGHRPEPARAGLGGRVEQAAEGVEVVAGDDRPARRQGVDELGVAVVDQVEQVELAAARRPGARARG